MLPEWEFLLWDDADLDTLFAKSYPHYVDAYRRIASGVIRSDLGRLAFLHHIGGFYFDTDYLLYKPIPQEFQAASCILPIETGTSWDQREFRIGNCFMAAAPGHKFFGDYLAHAFSKDPAAPEHYATAVGVAGPYAISQYLQAHRNEYPDIVFAAQDIFLPAKNRRTAETVGAHLCWGSWRKKSLVKAMRTLARRKANAIWPLFADALAKRA
ncbi:glycosyltransferase family 32 protein [Terrihabitans soli]|nr:glycosyltransferase [Terrihabitans soli]